MRPQYFTCHNGEKAPLPFADSEYETRLASLRAIMAKNGLEAAILTSMHNIAYYSGFLYCSFGRPYALVVTADKSTTVSANIDFGQPWRRCYGENLVFADWQRDNYWRGIHHLLGDAKTVGYEGDHLTLAQHEKMTATFPNANFTDIAGPVMAARMVKSPAEITLIKEGARICDHGGRAIRDAIKVGATELEVAMAGRDAMETEIARSFPDAEYRDTWVWFQSGLNTDGAHNPVTNRQIEKGDILSLNTFPMINGYYTALERTLFAEDVDNASLKVWEANVKAHEIGQAAIKPGATCSGICAEVNAFFEGEDLLQFRTFGYGHSFGVLSHYYGREAGLELREDIDTVLEPGMVVSMEPMLTLPHGQPGAGGYREHDILVVTENGAENITGFPYGPEFNVVG